MGISGITIPKSESNEIIVTQKALVSGRVMESVHIYDMAGRAVADYKNVSMVSLETFPHGEYIYTVVIEGKPISGKIAL